MKLQRLTALDINVLAGELNHKLTGCIIDNVISRANTIYFKVSDIVLRFHVFSGSPYLFLADQIPEGRNWLSAIRKGKIKSVCQKQFDRLIIFEVVVFDNLGKRKNFRICFEFFKNGNILLLDGNDKILESRRRSVKKREKYTLTKLKGFNVLEYQKNQILAHHDIEKIRSLNLLPYSDLIDQNSPALVKYIFDQIENPSPHIIKNQENTISGYSFYGPPFAGSFAGEKMPGLLEAITSYVESNIVSKSTKQTDFKKRLQKANKKLKAIKEELEEAKKFEAYRQFGDIILANIGSLKKGEKKYLLSNPYSAQQEQVEIPAEPALSPEKNAELYFDKARKFESSIPILKKRFDRQENEVARLKDHATNQIVVGKIDEIETGKKSFKKVRLPFRHYELIAGWHIYIGKSATSNDELTFSFAKKDDIWFHAWQAAGSHLILRRPEKGAVPDKNILLKAASIAAYFSKAKHSSKAPVIYTEVRYVRRIRKAAGKVNVTKEKQLMVTPLEPNAVISKQRSI